MSDLALITVAVFTEGGGGAYRHWCIDRAKAEALVADLGPADQERIQTADELEASRELVDGFETPPLIRSDEWA